MNPRFRIYVNADVVGVELGGALKNVIALAAGVCDGLDMGDNTKSALMTRGLAEMARLGVAMGAKAETFAGLSGMGDLIVTCGSMHSRNRRAGIFIGKGQTPAQAIEAVGTVEGYHAARTVWELAKKMQVDMPITERCYRVCYEGESPAEAIAELMERPKKHESERLWLGEDGLRAVQIVDQTEKAVQNLMVLHSLFIRSRDQAKRKGIDPPVIHCPLHLPRLLSRLRAVY